MFVSINMAMSLDGKIATAARGPMKLGSVLDSRRMAEIRAENDAVMNGASTFRAYPFPLSIRDASLRAERRARGQKEQPISAVVSSRLKIPRNTPWEKAEAVERWLFCGRESSHARCRSFEKSGVRVWKSRLLRPKPEEILLRYEAAGVRRLLLEGGGELNASFLERGLVDRIHLTLTPLLIGGAENPTWFEGRGFPLGKFPRWRLAECRPEGDEIYLLYERK